MKTMKKKHDSVKGLNMISKDLYEGIMDGITSGVWVADRDDVIYYANKAMEMVAGVTQQKLMGSCVICDSAKSTIKYFIQHYLEAKETLQPVYYSEIPVVTPAGKQTYQSGWLIPRVKNGFYNGMICIVEDITNQKRTQNALTESKAKYQELVENANSIIMQMDLSGNITFFNKFAQMFFGFPEEEIIGRNVVGTIVPSEERFVHQMERMLTGIGKHPERYSNVEYTNILKSGERVWVAWTNKAIFDEHGQVKEILCIGNDITARRGSVEALKAYRIHLEKVVRKRTAELKKANEALRVEISERKWAEEVIRSSEKKYRLVAENATEGIIVSQDGFFKYANPKAVMIFGYPEEELLARPFIEFIHPDDRDLVMERYIKRLKGDHLPHYSSRIIDIEGNVKWIEINAVLIPWMGRPATLTFFNNVTERKITEERLRLLESAIQQANDSIVVTAAGVNPSGPKVVFVNPAFTRMTGYTADEIMANPSIIQQGTITGRSELFRYDGSASSQNEAFYIETVNTHRNGTEFNLEWQITPVRDEKGKVTHFISIQRDITERKRAEEKLRTYQEQLRSLATELSLAEERERRRIATDLHDHIGQTLAITKIKLGALRDALSSDGCTTFQESLDDLRFLLDKTIQYTKTLTFELSPPILYDLGFSAAIEWLGEQIQAQYRIRFRFMDDENPKPLDRNVSILLFQAVRELFMNIVKHAYAEQVTVAVRRTGGNLQVTVEDDGVGFDISKVNKATSFGFFSIRERLNYFSGTIEVDSKAGQGTRVTLNAPVLTKELEGI